ncbi:hypothetical protein HII31_00041 [Pseudocercospora fuligena]|uniref:Metalloendopeptidase n=1 Tax=Pseudocercospora fuligena TaxID=685502 RepID=A0A8H6RVQ1_9PEZI|nr:hypothetical protein HII31_00041 [Pseudocercospora fuligena]
MGALLALLNLVLASAVLSTVACPPPDHPLLKRWYSVGSPVQGEPLTNHAWPAIEPASGSGRIQPVRYCWATESDYDTLHVLFEQAVQYWDIAKEQSALRIRSDTGTTSEPHKKCICSDPGVRPDALRVFDITGKDEYRGAGGVTTRGYRWDLTTAGRHYLKFRRTDERLDVLIMAHEIGHAIGFDHEQSRPDASQYLDFRCGNLLDYEETKRKIEEANNGDTIEDACKDRYIARKYGFSAEHFLPEVTRALGSAQWSKDFDDESIMLYGSYDGSKENRPVLLRKRRGQASVADLKMGGWAGAVSIGDVARVCQLYPDEHFDADEANENDPGWAPTSLPVPAA